MDGAGEDLLAGAALAGNQDGDWRRGDLARVEHHLAHLPGDNGVIAFRGEFVDGPEREAFLALDAPTLEVLREADEESDAVDGGLGLHVGQWLEVKFDRPVARGADGEGTGGVGIGDGAPRAEQFLGCVRRTRYDAGADGAAAVLEDGEEARGDEFGAARVHQEGSDVLN